MPEDGSASRRRSVIANKDGKPKEQSDTSAGDGLPPIDWDLLKDNDWYVTDIAGEISVKQHVCISELIDHQVEITSWWSREMAAMLEGSGRPTRNTSVCGSHLLERRPRNDPQPALARCCWSTEVSPRSAGRRPVWRRRC